MSMPAAAPWFYRLLLTLIVPLALLRLWWRGRKQPGYRQHIAERFGYLTIPAGGPIIWLHAVSVGETRAAEPLIQALLAQYPDHRVLLTHMTPTGRATSTALYQDPRILIAYVPYDLTGAVDRFLSRVNPRLGLLMETEIWPNLILRSRARHIPVLLINARMSARSAKRYARFDRLIRPVLGALTAVGAQTPGDAERLIALGAPSVSVTGNLKFDVRIDPALETLGKQWRYDVLAQQTRPIWLAASTREGEEAIILAAHSTLCALLPNQHPLLVLVPRHPQRFNDVATLVTREDFSLKRRSESLPDHETDVWLGDSMGEMVAYYSLADVAVIGGTLLPFGGQNLIEAAACGTPLIIGPHTYNFSAAANVAEQTGAATRIDITTPETVAKALLVLINNPTQHQAATEAAARFVSSATGATGKLLALIRQHDQN
ncbi:MAG: 3-deoxy-D-manno-octulosonic acid transferase [Pseudomonadota bacterium]|jgi:3-deoxy-D-manno-octulosonic-acid transferase